MPEALAALRTPQPQGEQVPRPPGKQPGTGERQPAGPGRVVPGRAVRPTARAVYFGRSQQVKPKVAKGKTAYVWVDALRFEMARELAQTLEAEFDVELQAALATVPTITAVGMAALRVSCTPPSPSRLCFRPSR